MSGVSLNVDSLALEIGETDTLEATVEPSNATDKSVTWSSSNLSVATVDSNGEVQGVSVGTADITVTTDDGGYSAICDVNVYAPSSTTTYELRIAGPTQLAYNEGGEYTAYMDTIVNGVTVSSDDVTSDVSFSVTVDPSELVTLNDNELTSN